MVKYGYQQLATQIANNLDDEVFCTRLVRRAMQHLENLSNEDDIIDFHAEPASTGRNQWDSLIKGLATHTWSLSGHDTPLKWAEDSEPLVDWWEPGFTPSRWRFWNLVNTPQSIREKRVIFPSQWLEAV